MLLAQEFPDSLNWTKRVQQVQFMNTQVRLPYWYSRTLSCGLFLLVLQACFCAGGVLIPLPGFYSCFPSFPYALLVFHGFTVKLHAELFIILCVLCLAKAGFVQCLSPASTPFKFADFVIFRYVFVCMRALPYEQRVCAMLFPWLPLVCTLCYIQ